MCSFIEQFACVTDSVVIGGDFNSQFVNGVCSSPDIDDSGKPGTVSLTPRPHSQFLSME